MEKWIEDMCAEIAHEVWAKWMRWQLTTGMTSEKWHRWERQSNTDFWDLPEEERASDYIVGDEVILPILGRYSVEKALSMIGPPDPERTKNIETTLEAMDNSDPPEETDGNPDR